MTTKIQATYECDRCHTTHITTGDDPSNWSEFTIQNWSRLHEAKKGHLCLICTRAVVQFIQSNPRDPHSSTRVLITTDPQTEEEIGRMK